MKRNLRILPALTALLLLLSGCGEQKLTDQPLTDIDSIRVITAMGNPDYGADSKTITDPEEIEALVMLFRGAVVKDQVRDGDLAVASVSTYSFYSGDDLAADFAFNGNDSSRVWLDGDYYDVEYGEGSKLPYELYQASQAQVVVVDESGNQMTRPAE